MDRKITIYVHNRHNKPEKLELGITVDQTIWSLYSDYPEFWENIRDEIADRIKADFKFWDRNGRKIASLDEIVKEELDKQANSESK